MVGWVRQGAQTADCGIILKCIFKASNDSVQGLNISGLGQGTVAVSC